MPEVAPMLIVCAEQARVEVELVGGGLSCPSCRGVLGPWGHARERVLRCSVGDRLLRPRRVRCRGGASATRHTPAGGRSRERLRSSRRRAPTSAAPGNRDVVAGQLADVDLTWADALLLRVLDHLKPLGEPSGASG
jgi:hypothetical protein